MGKIWFLKVLGIYLCVCASLFLFTTHSSGQLPYYPYGYQQSYYGSGFYTPPGGPPDAIGGPRPSYPFYSVFGRKEAYNPYGSYQQSYNPYGSYQQPYNPYGYQQPYNPYGYQPYDYEQPFISANYPPIGSRYPPWLQQSYYPYGYPLDDLPSGSILGFAPLGYGIPDGFNYGPINTVYGIYNGWWKE